MSTGNTAGKAADRTADTGTGTGAGMGAGGLWSHSAQELLDAAGSRRATPTSGAVIALGGAFAVSLMLLAVNLTLSKSAAPELTAQQDELRSLQSRLQALADEDAALYAEFMRQMQADDVTDEQRAALRLSATRLPLQLARELAHGLDLAGPLQPCVHRSVTSDVDSAAALLLGGLQAATLTVQHNLRGLDEAEKATFTAALRELEPSRQSGEQQVRAALTPSA